MAELLLEGRGRVSPATAYKDESLGYARVDDESSISAFLDPADSHRFMAIKEEPGRSIGLDIQVPYLGSFPITIQANTDFYVYCLGESIECLVGLTISMPMLASSSRSQKSSRQEFRRLSKNSSRAGSLLPDRLSILTRSFVVSIKWSHSFGSTSDSVIKTSIDLSGYRQCQRISGAGKKLDHVWFDVGPLTDCARLIWL